MLLAAAGGFALSYFLNCSSELVAPIVEEASLLFLGVVIKFFFEELMADSYCRGGIYLPLRLSPKMVGLKV